ncbi:hypothetical protein TrVE_jg688 [Triparma verrucosa]|jgi:acetyl-CoA acyltransferase|uniref:acetyl-CoA C-acyltransferase n=2 Tax=Triparma TaxID=722752 RepID=A0A9W7APP8_9STRA|nr:hypothetical protein TrVE_jg688 [Triparma verrucosa]GMH75479.1 hypothetical protein TrST_g13085 [Triparma strigata]
MLRNLASASSRGFATAAKSSAKNIVVVDGIRLPFAMQSTIYNDLLAVDLQRLALKALLTKTALDPAMVDYVLCGTVIQETKTSNIAREASMGAGIPLSVPSHTVTQACISSSVAICTAAEKIMAGQADVVIAGGVETFSDVPIRFSRKVRQKLIGAPKAMKKGPAGIAGLLKGLKPGDLAPEAPAIANYTTGEVMGVSSDRLSAKFGVSREDMDHFTVRSHGNAAKAHEENWYDGEVMPFNGSNAENGIKPSTYEKVSSLNPAFVKPYGTHTAANSSFLTDGASASLIMSEEKALELGFKPKSYIRDWAFVACDPFEELLLGPTYGAKKCLDSMNLKMEDIGVFEIHEAFAGQVLSNLTAMNSQAFADQRFNGKKVGEVDQSKMNTKGGSLSLGHPFGATGSRLVSTASNRLQKEEERFALLAACADGGLGHAAILERYDN